MPLLFAVAKGPTAACQPAQVIYVADTGNQVLRCLTPTALTTIAGRPQTAAHHDGAIDQVHSFLFTRTRTFAQRVLATYLASHFLS